MSLAFTFPGQGSQSVGMLEDLANHCVEVRQTFDEASGVLGYDLWQLTCEGPKQRLDSTEYTQPAMLAAGVAVWRAWRGRGGRIPDVVAGHSLGEYCALVCAESLGFEAAVRVVERRAHCMQAAVPSGEGAIAAVLGLPDAILIEICAAEVVSTGRHVSAVNFNAPGQVVIAGHADAVARVLEVARNGGAKRAIPLPMSVPVHCALMAPAAERFGETLGETQFESPTVPIVHNVDLEMHTDPQRICEVLIEQLTHPVRWVETVRKLQSLGVDTVAEPGPGRVLTGLHRRIDRGLAVYAIHDMASLEEALGAFA